MSSQTEGSKAVPGANYNKLLPKDHYRNQQDSKTDVHQHLHDGAYEYSGKETPDQLQQKTTAKAILAETLPPARVTGIRVKHVSYKRFLK
jgi:hypothetical protein